MNDSKNPSLDERIKQVASTYSFRFAGQPRHTRDPDLLERMIEELDTVLAAARVQSTTDMGDVLEKAGSMRSLYAREAQAIRSLQDGDPVEVLAHEHSSWVQLVHERYQRNFAGQSRSTRDLALLLECLDELNEIRRRVDSLAEREDRDSISQLLETMDKRQALYQGERAAIAEARESGTLEEQAGRFAQQANMQFAWYRDHFAGRSRLSRSIKTIQRVVSNLTQLKDRMAALTTQGYHSEVNEKNLKIVTKNLDMYTGEINAIRQAREGSSFEQLVDALGTAANEVIDQYGEKFAGQDRRTRELSDLNVICEGLYNLARQMNELDLVRESDVNQRNLDVVLDHLRLYQREYALIRDAQSGS